MPAMSVPECLRGVCMDAYMFTVERFGLVRLRGDKMVLGIRSSLYFYGVLHFWVQATSV